MAYSQDQDLKTLFYLTYKCVSKQQQKQQVIQVYTSKQSTQKAPKE